MALQVLRVNICLITMQAWEFRIRILGRNYRALSSISDTVGEWSRAIREARQDAIAALEAHGLHPWQIIGAGRAVRTSRIRSLT